jgi:hypothetical protein
MITLMGLGLAHFSACETYHNMYVGCCSRNISSCRTRTNFDCRISMSRYLHAGISIARCFVYRCLAFERYIYAIVSSRISAEIGDALVRREFGTRIRRRLT